MLCRPRESHLIDPCAAPLRALASLLLAAIPCAGGSPAGAQPSPAGPELQVNTYTTGTQGSPPAAVAADAQGNFVVVWTSSGSGGSDTSAYSIQAQRFGADASPLGSELQVNTYITGSQVAPAVARSSQGDFVVVWSSEGSSGTDSDGNSIQAQRFAGDGSPLGGQFQVNTYTTGLQLGPGVASDAQGNFVVVWASQGSPGSDTSAFSIQARRYAANGGALGDQLQVNAYTTGSQNFPAIARAGAGGFVVTWASFGSYGTDNVERSVQARRFDADGVPAGLDMQVNTYTTGDQSRSAVALDGDGNFLVVWSSTGSVGSDADAASIQGAYFDPLGVPLGGQFQVNSFTTADQVLPAADADAAGAWIVAWASYGSSGSDASAWSVQAQRYRPAGGPLGGEFQVNTYTTGSQNVAALAALPRGDFVVTWTSDGSAGTDVSGTSVHAQRFCGLFCDGFESGDVSGWSSSVP